MKRIAIITSGGDAPGMNAAIRAATLTAIKAGCEVFGVKRGYQGLLTGEIVELTSMGVSDILHRGELFCTPPVRRSLRRRKGGKRRPNNCKILGLKALS